MKSSLKKFIIIEAIMIFIALLNFFIPNIFTSFGIILYLGISLAILIYLFGIDFKIQVNEKKIIINTLIYITIYFLIIYIFGYFVGFNKTVYNISLTNIFNNIIPTLMIIILSEIIRYILIKRSNNKYVTIISTILFIILDLSINFHLYNLTNQYELRELLGGILLPSIAKNIFLTISMIKTGYFNNIIYRMIVEMYVFIVPIVPAFSSYLNSSIMIFLPLILSLVIIYTTKKKVLSGKEIKYNKYNKILIFSVFIIISLIIFLNSGVFKYQTLTVGSDSMKNYMSKGDIIIVEKLNEKEKKEIKDGDILVFKYNTKLVAHRVNRIITSNSKIYFETKGDNNEQVDNKLIEVKDVVGLSKFRIKYLGLPSIWLKELVE